MCKLLRYYAPGQYCFVTSITANRCPILVDNFSLLAQAVRRARQRSRFTVMAWVVIPEHIHALILTPNGDTNKIVQRVKLSFSLLLRKASGSNGPFWQHRYWDHIIRSEDDMRRHIDYIHYNPVKHGLTDSPSEWALSSFRKYLKRGMYQTDWGTRTMDFGDGSFGE